ncbi:MAG: precorrin-4 C(11)-methyltransferase [Anaerolineae bacterium]|nr:precorrin-4 C(11)-methyltransferase [Anaerolineae bacterium]
MAEKQYQTQPGTVYFVGAGPGAPDLITVRGQDIIAQADLILYADSLVEESVAKLARKPEARIETSSHLHLEQILELMVEVAQSGGVVARIHSGDPALYGAIHEQMAYLEDYQIPYEIVPGVTAVFAAAAQLKTELTVPDVVQTIILTRTAGRTTMPEGEDLRTLAAPGASLAIYLSVSRIRHVIDDLLASGGYGPETPVAVHHKVTWPDESHVTGTLADIAEKVKKMGYTKHALILVSPALDPSLKGKNRRTSSHLYDKSYTHRFRRAEDFQRGKERREAQGAVGGVVAGEKHLGSRAGREGSVVIAITKQGSQLAAQLAADLGTTLAIPAKFESVIDPSISRQTPTALYSDSSLAEIRLRWAKHNQLILVMPTGVAVRAIAPLLGHKSSDPAVVCLDESGQSVIPLLGGHQAGANALAHHIAELTGGVAAITTASDVQGKPALDQLGQADGWRIDPNSALTYASACLVNDDPIGVYLDPELDDLRSEIESWLAPVETITWVDQLDDLDLDAYAAGLIISHRPLSDHHLHFMEKCVLYRPPVLIAGMGCKRGVPTAELRLALETTLHDANLALDSVAALATVDLKADEAGLQILAEDLRIPLLIIDQTELAALPADQFSPSAAQDKFDLPGVAEPCAVTAAGSEGRLLVPKRSFDRCTVAISML